VRIENFIPAFILTLATATWSQPLLTPEDALAIGLKNNPSLSIARDASAIATLNRETGIGPFLPDLNATARHGGEIGRGTGNTSLGLSSSLLIFDGFQTWNGYKRLQVREEGARVEERLAVETAVEDILAGYYGIAQEKRRLESIKELLAVSEERARLAQARMEVGAGSRLEQLQALSDLNADSASFLSQQVALKDAKSHLNALLGRTASEDFDVLDTIPLEPSLPAEDLRKALKDGNSQLRLARLDRKSAERGLEEARGGYWPSLNAGLGYSTTPEALASDEEDLREDGVTYSLSLSVPLFNRFRTRQAVGNARLGLRQADTRIRQRELEVEGEFERALDRHAMGIRRVTLEERNLEVSMLQAEAARERYRLGASSPLEFRDAQTRLLDSRSRLASARQETKNAELALKRLAGQLVKEAP
jgi:outer membrane protein